MPVYRIEVLSRESFGPSATGTLARQLREVGLEGLAGVTESRLYLVEGPFSQPDIEKVGRRLLADSVTETIAVLTQTPDIAPAPAQSVALEVHPRPGVMDPVAMTVVEEMRAEGVSVAAVRTARRYVLHGVNSEAAARSAAARILANECIEELVIGTAGVRPAAQPRIAAFELKRVSITKLGDAELEALSRRGHLFLSLAEMRAIQTHFAALGREPTDLELETLAQTWSEHCVHKSLKSSVVYRGAAMPAQSRSGNIEDLPDAQSQPGAAVPQGAPPTVELRYENLLRDTIARSTHELMAAGRGPECLSVFKDNAGVIAFDEQDGIAFKVETHNRPSAIEPYGGAATGVGGCIRDVLGCGLGARPIANTDVFCVAPGDWPADELPKGVLHPARVLRGVVDGVGDYGNRMGIPTVNGAVYFDPRYLGNPLVYCGCVGMIPRDKVEKQPQPGDRIVVIGGRTGRDGIHGATFSSAELTETHADEFSHAVQIGNAITEKRVLDALMRARDAAGGCLYSAVTDCGAGGLSSAVGEMAAEIGATVDLEHAPLKYEGLRYDEIWISEAQERMVLAVPPERLTSLRAIMAEECVEATDIGVFGSASAAHPRLVVRYRGTTVGDLDLKFLHDGVPKLERVAEWTPIARDASSAATTAAEGSVDRSAVAPRETIERLLTRLASPNVASKEWIIRRYDHEVQGATSVKPLCGPGEGPSGAAVLRPKPGSRRAAAIGCGLAPALSDVDPYWMAVVAIDEALNNVVCVGGDPARAAILDNFCWPRTDDPRHMGALVRACQACYDAAMAWNAPFISGKDSLNNEFSLDPADVERVIASLKRRFAAQSDMPPEALAAIEARIRATGRLSIPPTLLISALALIDDVRTCVTGDLKQEGNPIWLIGGLPRIGFDLASAGRFRAAVAAAIRDGAIRACQDAADGWLTAVAEMAIGGWRGATIGAATLSGATEDGASPDPFMLLAAGFVVEVSADRAPRLRQSMQSAGVTMRVLGAVGSIGKAARFNIGGESASVDQLQKAWRGVAIV